MTEVDWAAVDTVVCDIDGVIVRGSSAVEGAATALVRLRDAGKDLHFVTNNSTKTRQMIARRIADVVGFETPVSSIVNSGWATGLFIAGSVERVYVLGTDGLRDTLRQAGITVVTDWRAADAVVAGLDFDVTFRSLRDASLAVQHGAAFYATNTDQSYPAEDGHYPGAGALVSVIVTTTGRHPIVCGKPHEPIRRLLQGLSGRRPVVVGDRPETDIALGRKMGWATVLVLTGVTDRTDEVLVEHRPDLVLDSLAALPATLGI